MDFIRFNPTKTLVNAYLCIDGMPAKPGLEYYKHTDIKTSPLYKYPEEHYANYAPKQGSESENDVVYSR